MAYPFLQALEFEDEKFERHCLSLSEKLVTATLQGYNLCLEKLLPTPAKSHYLFNLRDISRSVFSSNLFGFAF